MIGGKEVSVMSQQYAHITAGEFRDNNRYPGWANIPETTYYFLFGYAATEADVKMSIAQQTDGSLLITKNNAVEAYTGLLSTKFNKALIPAQVGEVTLKYTLIAKVQNVANPHACFGLWFGNDQMPAGTQPLSPKAVLLFNTLTRRLMLIYSSAGTFTNAIYITAGRWYQAGWSPYFSIVESDEITNFDPMTNNLYEIVVGLSRGVTGTVAMSWSLSINGSVVAQLNDRVKSNYIDLTDIRPFFSPSNTSSMALYVRALTLG